MKHTTDTLCPDCNYSSIQKNGHSENGTSAGVVNLVKRVFNSITDTES